MLNKLFPFRRKKKKETPKPIGVDFSVRIQRIDDGDITLREMNDFMFTVLKLLNERGWYMDGVCHLVDGEGNKVIILEDEIRKHLF